LPSTARRARVGGAYEAAVIRYRTDGVFPATPTEGLGVTFERRDLMKPVLLRLSRKVDPEELYPGRSFPMR
jgi:hypothetical protein